MLMSARAVCVAVCEFFQGGIPNPGHLHIKREIHPGQRMIAIQGRVGFSD